MNKSYRTVWNEALGAWVAASEITKARGKRSRSGTVVAAAAMVLVLGGAGNAIAQTTRNVDGGIATGASMAISPMATGGDCFGLGVATTGSALGLAIGCAANTTTGSTNIAIGTAAHAGTSDGSGNGDQLAIGYGAQATGVDSLALGAQVQALSSNSLAIGNSGDGVDNNSSGAISNRIEGVARNAYAGVAAAMATQMPGTYVPGKTVMRVGSAVFKGESAVGISFRRTSENNGWSVTGGVGMSRAGVAATVGAEWVFN